MPLDTSIPLRINPVQLPDFNALAQQRLSNVSNMMAITAQQKAMQEQEAIKAAYQGALNPQTRQIDYDKLIAGVAPIKPDLIPQIQQHRAQEQEAKQKSIEFGQKQIGTQFQTALNDPTDETLKHVRANLTAFGMPAEALDAELEPIMKLPVDQRHGAIFNRLAADPQTREALKFTMPDPKETNLGGTVAFIDMNPNSPTFKQTLSEKQVTMSQYQRAELGGQAAARAETARHNRREELNDRLDKNKPPSGYNWAPNGSLVAIPGGPADRGAQPLTEVQGKAVTFGARMKDADRQLSALDRKGVSNTGIVKNTVGSVVNLVPFGVGEKLNAMTDAGFNTAPGILGGPNADQQTLDQAQRNFVNAVLRRESGAAINESEFQNAKRQYFRQPGDTQEVIAQKQRNRNIAIQGIRREAGPGAVDIDRISAPPPSPRRNAPAKPKGGGVDIRNPLLSGG